MKKILALLSICISLNVSAATVPVNVTVTKVHDGDSLTVINENKLAEKIRIFRIDSPEIAYSNVPTQPYAIEARTGLEKICLNKPAILTRKSLSYGRSVAIVNCAGVDVATYQLLHGNAWVYRYNATKALTSIQNTAKTNKLGLWALPNPVEPYSWRRGVR